MDIKPGDQVVLHKPLPPFSSYNYPKHQKGSYIFDLTEMTWDNYAGKSYLVHKIATYKSRPAVKLVDVTLDGRYYLWPLDCVTPVGAKKGQIPCDCPWELVRNQGCQKKEHY